MVKQSPAQSARKFDSILISCFPAFSYFEKNSINDPRKTARREKLPELLAYCGRKILPALRTGKHPNKTAVLLSFHAFCRRPYSLRRTVLENHQIPALPPGKTNLRISRRKTATVCRTGKTLYSTVYFFIAHHRIYQTRIRTTILKGLLIFVINGFSMLILLLGLIALSFLMIH
ncbi:MAG: hypothetical protein BGO40_11055 [Chryseobacterium sp. 39-10]|nr:MAG: hypothetical protein BGO40_11055 [Chryseobacterium sp. 39-10]